MGRYILTLFLLFASPLVAAQVPYTLDAENSVVGFSVFFGRDEITGRMPVIAADIALDFERPERSTVDVTLNAADAQASFPFARQALIGPRMLDTRNTPTITFRATRITTLPGPGLKAEMEGDLTIRGTTRPATFAAEIFRQRDGAAEGDLSALSIHLNAEVNRSEFGADGWADLVEDKVEIRIVARINRAP